MLYSSNREFDWDELVNNVKEGNCVVFIGPDLFTGADGKSLMKNLSEKLAADIHPNEDEFSRTVYYPEEELFYLGEKREKSRSILSKVVPFFRELKKNVPLSPFEMLAELPFPLYISLTPDVVLHEVLRNKKTEFQASYYKANDNKVKNTDKPTKDKPLIYNLFGTFEDADSMVLTNDMLIDLMFSLSSPKSIPTEVLEHLRNVNFYLLLGVKLDKWYMRPLLRLLESIKGENKIFSQYATVFQPDAKNVMFCETNFNLQFLSDNPAEFVEKLHLKCGDILRNSEKSTRKISEQIAEMIFARKAENALTELLVFLKKHDPDTYESLKIKESALKEIREKTAKRLFTDEKAEVEINNFLEDLKFFLGIVREIENGK
jgi:hypothetical protein